MGKYYEKEPLVLQNAFKAKTNDVVQPVDERMFHDQAKVTFNEENKNNLYRPNEQLLLEIERTQKLREYERIERQRIRERMTQ